MAKRGLEGGMESGRDDVCDALVCVCVSKRVRVLMRAHACVLMHTHSYLLEEVVDVCIGGMREHAGPISTCGD